LDNALQAMANVTELIDDVDDADKRSDNDKYLDRRYRKAPAYEALDHLLTTAIDKNQTLQSRLADYHKASPELAHWLARWQADDAKT
jgi:predicted  nucleic acid-binding Zn-ribbon protein